MGNYANGSRPVPPWRLYLNFNKKHKSFELLPEHFTADGQYVSDSLIRRVEEIDPGWRVKGAKPVFRIRGQVSGWWFGYVDRGSLSESRWWA